jgi:hypothetical protein
MKRSADTAFGGPPPNPDPAPAGVSWGLGVDVRFALFAPSDAKGCDVIGWPRTVYYVPGARGVLEGVTFVLYALADVALSDDDISHTLQLRYLWAHAPDDAAELAALRKTSEHAHRLALVLTARESVCAEGGRASLPAQSFLRVRDCTDGAVSFRYAPFVTPRPAADGTVVAPRATRIVELETRSHHVFAHLLNQHARFDDLVYDYKKPTERRYAFALLVKDRATPGGRTTLARQANAVVHLRAQLPLEIDAFAALMQQEKVLADRARAARRAAEDAHFDPAVLPPPPESKSAPAATPKKRYDLHGHILPPAAADTADAAAEKVVRPVVKAVQTPLAFKATSTLSVQCATADVRRAYGVLCSGEFSIYRDDKFRTAADIGCFLSTKSRWLETIVTASGDAPFFKVDLQAARIVRALVGGGALDAEGRPRVKTTDELVAAYTPPPPPPPKPPKKKARRDADTAARALHAHVVAAWAAPLVLDAPPDPHEAVSQ